MVDEPIYRTGFGSYFKLLELILSLDRSAEPAGVSVLLQ